MMVLNRVQYVVSINIKIKNFYVIAFIKEFWNQHCTYITRSTCYKYCFEI